MVNRVFVYSNAIATKNKLNNSIIRMVLEIFGLVILMTLFIFLMFDIFDDNPTIYILFMILWISIILFYAINKGLKLKSGLMGFATDTNNNLYCAIKLNNGEDFAIGGLALGNVINSLSPNDNNVLGNATQVVGSAIALYQMNNSLKIMANPEVISQMVIHANELSGGVVNKILKVHDIKVYNKKVKIIYDYQDMKTNKQKYNKKLTIYNVYNSFDDLIQKFKERM